MPCRREFSSALRWIAVLACSWGMASCLDRDSFLAVFDAGENQPIECHVRLVDQDGRELKHVPVRISVWSKTIDGHSKDIRALPAQSTDDQGCIHVTGERGGYLGIAVADDQYITGLFPASLQSQWMYVLLYTHNGGLGSIRHGTAGDPAVYSVWHREGPQPLVVVSGELRIAYDGRPLRVDLVKSALVDEGGDFVVDVSMAKTEAERKAQADHRGIFPYEANLTMIDGACHPLPPGDEDDMYPWLPGLPTVDFPLHAMPGQPQPDFAGAKGVVFSGLVRLRNGAVVGKARIAAGVEPYWRTDQGRVVIRVDAVLNPTGSRSLEPDPAKMVRVKLTDSRASVGK